MKSITCIHCKKCRIGVFDTPTGDFCVECWNQTERLTRYLLIQAHNIYLDVPDWSMEYTSEEYRRFERNKAISDALHDIMMTCGLFLIFLIFTKIFGVW